MRHVLEPNTYSVWGTWQGLGTVLIVMTGYEWVQTGVLLNPIVHGTAPQNKGICSQFRPHRVPTAEAPTKMNLQTKILKHTRTHASKYQQTHT